jgi:signal transduction histidine kinase
MHQVIINLVVNAIQATPPGGKISLETSIENDQIILQVVDSGLGIEDKNLNRIFMPFFTTKDVNEGTGLGLAVAHGIVLAHHGQISVSSKINEGSCFKVQLPIENDQ